MKPLYLLFFISAICISCSPLKKALDDPRCAEQLTEFQKYWSYNSETDLYAYTGKSGTEEMIPLRNMMQDLGCVKSFNAKSVARYFGKPNQIQDGKWYYYHSLNCARTGPESNGCSFTTVTFNSDKRVKSIIFLSATSVQSRV